MLNIGWFSTGRDEAARQLLQAVQESISTGEIKGKINFVFSNREPGESQESDLFFELVHGYGIPLIYFSYRKFKARLLRGACPERDSSVASLPQNDKKRRARNDIFLTEKSKGWRIKYDREVNRRIERFSPDLCVLAGYMLIIGEELCQKYNIINLHPAPPGGPVGSWQEVIWKLIQSKAKEAGAMMHMVTPELDRGPVLSYCFFPINHKPFDQYWQKEDKEPLFKLIRQHELDREFPLIIFTLKALSRGEIAVQNGKVLDAQGNIIQGYDLTEEINRVMKGNST